MKQQEKKLVNEYLDKFAERHNVTRVVKEFKKENGLLDYEVGKVYKNDVIIFLLTSIDDDMMVGYGLTLDGKEHFKPNTPITEITDDLLVEATSKEWEERLKDYAKENYPIGTVSNISNLRKDKRSNFTFKEKRKWVYYARENRLAWEDGELSYDVFINGVWAEIIEQPKAEIKEEKDSFLLNRTEIKNLLHSTTNNIKDFVMNEDEFINEWMQNNNSKRG